MAFFPDLSPCTYFGCWEDRLVAIGWLDPAQSHVTGEVGEAFFAALILLLKDPWAPLVLAGRERCRFCGFSGGPAQITYKGSTVGIGASNLFIPAGDRVFVAPSLIAHYIDSHAYCPPAAFQEAVIACPEMNSLAYLKKLRDVGIGQIPR